MELVDRHRPHRAVIRCKAKMQLLEIADESFDWDKPFDDALLKELATSLFQSNRYRVFFETFLSQHEAKEVEDQLAQELADTYQTIVKRRHEDPVVQSLNALL
jgi:hypothetical protein